MKEIDAGDYYIFEYDNDKIYYFRRKIRNLCLVSLILAILSFIVYVLSNTLERTWNSELFSHYFLFFMCLLLEPTGLFLAYRREGQRPSSYPEIKFSGVCVFPKFSKKRITKFPYVMIIISFTLDEIIKVSAILLFLFTGLLGGDGLAPMAIWCYHIGYMFLSALFIYIALYYVVKRCNLMQTEWDKDPPNIVKQNIEAEKNEQEILERQRKKEQEAEQHQRDLTLCKELTETSGIRFFIKYYNQIKRLPLRDVTVTENYSPAETDERLQAAKKIIDLGLTRLALNEIIKNYADALDEKEVNAAKSILFELNGVKQYKPKFNEAYFIDQINTLMNSESGANGNINRQNVQNVFAAFELCVKYMWIKKIGKIESGVDLADMVCDERLGELVGASVVRDMDRMCGMKKDADKNDADYSGEAVRAIIYNLAAQIIHEIETVLNVKILQNV